MSIRSFIDQKSELLFGLIGLLVLVSSYWGFQFLKGENVFSSVKTFYADYEQIGNLRKSSHIFVNGFKVGHVQEIELLEKNQQVRLTLSITEDINIPIDSKLEIASNSLVGGLVINLKYGKSKKYVQTEYVFKGTMAESLTDKLNKDFKKLSGGVTTTLSKTDSILLSLNNIMNLESQQAINASLQSMAKLSKELVKATRLFNQSFGNREANLKKTAKSLTNVSQNLNTITDSLAQVKWTSLFKQLEGLTAQLNEMTTRFNSDSSSLGMMNRDPRLYTQLLETTKQAGELMEDVKLNPKRYIDFSIFGRDEPAPYSPPKKRKESRPTVVNQAG